MRNQQNHIEDSPTAPLILIRWSSFKPWDRHGLILIVAGLMYILIGAMFVSSPTSRLGDVSINIFPGNTIYLGFIVVGIISMFSARWPNKPRTLGYTVLSGWTAATGCIYLYGGFEQSSSAFMAFGLVWTVLAFLWWAISGLISPPSERASSGVPSPHRDHSGGFDRYAGGSSHTALFEQGKSHASLGVKSVGDGERRLRAS